MNSTKRTKKTAERRMVRGYLMHLSHYDPSWVKTKHLERRFSLKLAMSLVDEMAKARLNTLIIDVADGVQYATHPELRRAYSAPLADYRQLVAYAQKHGLEVIPKLNFAKGTDLHNAWMSPYDELPDSPEYFARALRLIDELTGGLKIKFFHLGMDEDDRPTSQFVKVINDFHALLQERNLRTVIWADIGHSWAPDRHRKFVAAVRQLPQDTILMPWTYDLRSQKKWLVSFKRRGLEVWGGVGPELTNIEMWRDDILAVKGEGLIATTWLPLATASVRPQRQIIRDAGQYFPS